MNLNNPYLTFQDLSFRYDDWEACELKKVNFSLNKGDTLGLVGTSGCGKSTLCRLIVKLLDEQPKSGKIILDGVDIYNGNPDAEKMLRKKVRYIYQDADCMLNPGMSIHQVLKTVIKLNQPGIKNPEINKKITTILRDFRICIKLHKSVKELSGGEKRRISIAKALLTQPELLIADEPFSSLDVINRNVLLKILTDIKEKNPKITMIIVSHDITILPFLCNKILVMKDGECVEFKEMAGITTFSDFKKAFSHQHSRELISAVINNGNSHINSH